MSMTEEQGTEVLVMTKALANLIRGSSLAIAMPALATVIAQIINETCHSTPEEAIGRHSRNIRTSLRLIQDMDKPRH